ncbi:MAG: lytic transglycosylase F [Thermoanaerobaculia bacterium]
MRKPSHRLILILTTILVACGDADSPTIGSTAATAAAAQAANAQSLEDDPLINPVLRPWTGDLPGIHQRRAIRVLVSYGPTNYFIRGGQALGFEAELMHRYDEFLNRGASGRELRTDMVFVPVPFDRLLPALIEGRGDIVAAGLTVTPEREKRVAFTDPYLPNVAEIVVSGKGVQGLESLTDLAGRTVYAVRGSSFVGSLRALSDRLRKEGHKAIEINEIDEILEQHDLLEMVNAGILELTVVDDHIAEIWSGVLPDIVLRRDLEVAGGGRIGWAVRQESPKLRKSLNTFLGEHKSGTLTGNILFKRYYRDTKWVKNPVAATEVKRVRELIPIFRKYGDQFGIDWLMLAAQGYQESGLDQTKKSSSGALGVMQIKPSTAADKSVGIPDIGSADSNIHAGTKYLAYLRDSYFGSDEIEPMAQIHLSLAGYNAGPNRVQQLRKKAESMGLDPNVWFFNVERAALAEGVTQPVHYVANIHKYYVAYKLSLDTLLRREVERQRVSGN